MKEKKDISILFVEDEIVIALNLALILKRRFARVHTANDGEDGLRLFKEYCPDIVITDIIMPKMDGLKMINHIREIDEKVPIIIMTAVGDDKAIEEAKSYNIHGYLTKPIYEKDFLDLLYTIVDEIENSR